MKLKCIKGILNRHASSVPLAAGSLRERGVALVVTLIMLSAITFMAVTFLVVSRREGAQVDTIGQQSNAKFAAEEGFESAKAQILARMISTTNGLKNDMLVSTNYITPGGFFTGVSSVLNVNYTNADGTGLTAANLPIMLKNLFILPRAPVFVDTNNGQKDFRYFQDLNRNGLADPTGPHTETDENGNFVNNFYTGDPEWIGILDRPDQPHSSSNLFVGRYCFIALPIGDSLDMNFIHNQNNHIVNGSPMGGTAADGFLRNQGVGSWEINLGAFFHYLNTNWDSAVSYAYNTPGGFVNAGASFGAALQLQQFRYNGDWHNLNTLPNIFNPSNYLNIYNEQNVDYAGFGPVMTTYTPTNNYFGNRLNAAWDGADNSSLFYSSQDIFKNPYSAAYGVQSLSNLLFTSATSTQTNTEHFFYRNRYSFYRMLSQMSFESAPEPSFNTNLMPGFPSYPYTRKINLNYNVIYKDQFGIVHPDVVTTNNFVPWTNATEFFTNVADRMLRATFPDPIVVTNVVNGVAQLPPTTNYLCLTNIPIYPANLYTPAVHRILQLTANIWDAMTNKISTTPLVNYDYPTVMRPIIRYSTSPTTNVWISGYFEQQAMHRTDVKNFLQVSNFDLRRPGDLANLIATQPKISTNNIYGLPYVIGARAGTGFPAFNKIALAPVVTILRKMQLNRITATPTYTTNLQYELSISNLIGADFWNPYSGQTYYSNILTVVLTNDFDTVLSLSNYAVLRDPNGVNYNNSKIYNTNFGFVISVNPALQTPWSGEFGITNAFPNSFRSSYTNQVLIPGSVLIISNGISVLDDPTKYASLPIPPNSYFIPHFMLAISNRVHGFILDSNQASGLTRIIDYVQLGGLGQAPGMDDVFDVETNLQVVEGGLLVANRLWSEEPVGTNRIPRGFFNQINISQGIGQATPIDKWMPVGLDQAAVSGSGLGLGYANTEQDAIDKFKLWMGTNTLDSRRVPYAAYTRIAKTYVWAANDPLVHYMVNDLVDSGRVFSSNAFSVYKEAPLLYGQTLGKNILAYATTNRVMAWGYNSQIAPYSYIATNEMAYKDSGMTFPDKWNFPTNKFPNIGWLGRVHRGTPWQTFYLKAGTVDLNAWSYWTGNQYSNYSYFTKTVNGSVVTNYYLKYPAYATNGVGNYIAINFGTKRDVDYTQPTNDWALLDLFTTAPDDNASRGQLSVNQTNMAAWAAVLTGVHVLTSNTNGVYIDPNDNYNGFQKIYRGITNYINSTNSAGQYNLPGQVFTGVGQILAVPELTTNSPYIVPQPGVTYRDEVYERIPQQIMGLLRVGSPRYVVFAYGQSLKPAQNSVLYSGANLGLCTNYQITGEYASRTLFRVENHPVPGHAIGQQPKVVIESFNVMQPE